MRTRRSWRNQNRVWKMLSKGDWQTVTSGKALDVKPKPVTYTTAEIDGMFWMRKDERERFKQNCRDKGTLV